MPIDTQLTTLFCLIDGFCTDISEQVEQYMLTCGKIKRVRQSQICASDYSMPEVMRRMKQNVWRIAECTK